MKLAILDRDGVINFDSDLFIKSPAEWRPIPGSIEAIARMNQNGYRVAVATNQSGIGRGLFDMATFNAINDKMMEMVFRHGGRIDALFFCPHTAAEECSCRKPRTGMLEEIATRFHTDLKGVPFVGDALKDMQAAEAVGALPMLVLTGKGRVTQEQGGMPKKTLVFEDLADAARHLIAHA
ncbi:MAG TPA: D-glycero-beta-D-manno-heptose 1,7-bisphosphate 7-phosphatase [Usitatibacter sp.]|nr:D-glycero-beta-D-manno-heptose 1,7-bisphosphate 7-phosphatase [Usitatibacter sp.]